MLKYVMIFLGALFASAFVALPLHAQTTEGVILDHRTGEPLAGATIHQTGTQNGTSSGPSGEFTLDLLPERQQSLTVSFIGYATHAVDIRDEELSLEIRLQPSMISGDAIFVEDVRVEEHIPVTQTTIGRAQIESDNKGQDPIYTLERLSPSILTHSDSGTRFANYGYMRLRGMDQTRINMTLNGIPLNDMIDQGVFFSNFNDFGNSIQSVQVQRGVGTSTHGTASYAGSVNFESVSIDRGDPSAGVKLAGGAFGSSRISSEVNTGAIGNFGFYSRFSKTESDGYRDHSGTEATSFFLSGGYFGDRDIVKVTAFSGSTQNELAYTPVPIDLIRENPRTNLLPEHDVDHFTQQFLQLQYGRSVTDELTMTSSLYYGGAGGDFPVGFPDDEGNFVQQIFGLENDHYGFQSTAQYRTGSDWELTGGLHIYRFDRVNRESFEPEAQELVYRDQSQKDEFSAFVKGSYRLGDVELFGDLQLRTLSLEFQPDHRVLTDQNVTIPVWSWTFVSPKVGITWFLSDRTDVYASFGHSGREPTRHDILGGVNINDANLPSAMDPNSVRPEYVNDIEAGIRFGSSLFAGKLNGFYMQFTDEISPTGEFIPEGFVQLRENIERSYRAGVEAEWNWQLAQDLNFFGNATWMRTGIREFTTGGETYFDKESILSPEWLANGTLLYSLNRNLDLSLTGRYMSEAFLELTNNPEMILPSFFVADIGIDARLGRHLSASVKMHNIFDELYFTNGAPLDTNFDGLTDSPGYIVQPPRHLFFELSVQF